MWGFPHNDDPEESMREELWAGVTSSEQSSMIWTPMKEEVMKLRVEGSISKSIKPYET